MNEWHGHSWGHRTTGTQRFINQVKDIIFFLNIAFLLNGQSRFVLFKIN